MNFVPIRCVRETRLLSQRDTRASRFVYLKLIADSILRHLALFHLKNVCVTVEIAISSHRHSTERLFHISTETNFFLLLKD